MCYLTELLFSFLSAYLVNVSCNFSRTIQETILCIVLAPVKSDKALRPPVSPLLPSSTAHIFSANPLASRAFPTPRRAWMEYVSSVVHFYSGERSKTSTFMVVKCTSPHRPDYHITKPLNIFPSAYFHFRKFEKLDEFSPALFEHTLFFLGHHLCVHRSFERKKKQQQKTKNIYLKHLGQCF